MRRMIRALGCGCLLALSLAESGCGGLSGAPEATSSTATARVKGKVTVGGKPLSQAEVRFNPSNVNRKNAPVVTSVIGDDGTYEVTTLVGQNQVSLGGAGASKTPQVAYFTKTFDVQAGSNDFDITLP